MSETFGWKHIGQSRPDFAVEPEAGQESVWDYPRPPSLVTDKRAVRIEHDGQTLANTHSALKLKETASPPTFYVPKSDINFEYLIEVSGQSFCEWKGKASYIALKTNPSRAVAWTYLSPKPAYIDLLDHYCFYPSRVTCWLGDERVRAQQSEFYGGWITDDIVGPFKGEPGTSGW